MIESSVWSCFILALLVEAPSYNRECVRNLDLRVQVHPGELWVSKSAGAHSTRSLKISGCKRWCPKDLRVCAPSALVLTHSLYNHPFVWTCWIQLSEQFQAFYCNVHRAAIACCSSCCIIWGKHSKAFSASSQAFLGPLVLCWIFAVVPFEMRLISSWEKNNKLSNWQRAVSCPLDNI